MQVAKIFIPDTDECEDATICNTTTSTCENNLGSFECVCLEGFEKENEDCIGKGHYLHIQFVFSFLLQSTAQWSKLHTCIDVYRFE